MNVRGKRGGAIAVGLFAVSTFIYAEPVTVIKFDFEGASFEGASLPCSDTAGFPYTADTFFFINEGVDTVITTKRGTEAYVRSDQTVDLNKNREMNYKEGTYWTFDLIVRDLAEGEKLNLTAFDYTYRGDRSWYFRTALLSSVDGFGKGKELVNYLDINNKTDEKGYPYIPPTTLHTDLSENQGFQGLENEDVIKFRIYIGDRAKGTARLHIVDNVVVTGEVVSKAK